MTTTIDGRRNFLKGLLLAPAAGAALVMGEPPAAEDQESRPAGKPTMRTIIPPRSCHQLHSYGNDVGVSLVNPGDRNVMAAVYVEVLDR